MKRSVICCGDGDVVDIRGGDGGGASRRGGGRGEERWRTGVLRCECATCVSDKGCGFRARREAHKSITP